MEHDLTMLVDLYELTMANGMLLDGKKDTITYFDMFFSAVCRTTAAMLFLAGLEQLMDYFENLHFFQMKILSIFVHSIVFCEEFF